MDRGYVDARTADLLARRRAEMEWFIAWGRITFTALIFARTLSIGAFAAWKLYHLVLPISVSVWVLWRVRRRRYTEWDLVLVVIADAVIAALALGGNIFEVHGHGYRYIGLFRMPDIAICVFVVALAALRFSERGVLASGLANGTFGVVLAWIDKRVHGDALWYGMGEVSMYLTVIGATTALGIYATSRLRRLLTEHALTLVREERSRTNLDEVLRDSHDVRASLQAAMIDVTLLRRSALLQKSESDDDNDNENNNKEEERLRQATSIDENLRNVADHLRRIRRYSAGEARAALRIESAAALDVIEESVRALRVAFPDRTITVEGVGSGAAEAGALSVVVVAGPVGLRRIVDNLLRNACEGTRDGSAKRITIRVEANSSARGERSVVLHFEDDGPGFEHDARIAIEQRRQFTSKTSGEGVGLAIVRRTVEESGGTFEIARDERDQDKRGQARGDADGAHVIVTLRCD